MFRPLLLIYAWCFRWAFRLTSQLFLAVFRRTRSFLTSADQPMEVRFGWAFKLATTSGLVLFVVCQLHWKWAAQGYAKSLTLVQGNAVEWAFLTPLYVCAAVVLGTLIMIAAAHRPARRRSIENLLKPVGRVGVIAAVTVLLYIALRVTGASDRLSTPSYTSNSPEEVGFALLMFIGIILFLALMVAVFAFYSAVLLATSRDLLGAHDGHPQLRPLVTLLIALWSVYRGIRAVAEYGLDRAFPMPLSVILAVGPIGSCILAVVEMRLRERDGARFRWPKP